MRPDAESRIAITGLGTVNALGRSVEEFRSALRAGTCGIGPLTVFDPAGYRSGIAAEAALPDDVGVSRALARRLSRSDRFALAAVREALAESGLDAAREGHRIALVVGGTTGGMLRAETAFADRATGRRARYDASGVIGSPISVSADVVAGTLGIAGPRLTLSTACSSSANALGVALDWLRLGRVDAVVAGGTESLCRMTYAGFNALHAVSAAPCRPFDRTRDGLSIGEGAAFLVLERRARAERRSAPVHAELLSYGNSSDAHHMTAPHPEGHGAALAMERALRTARLDPSAIDYVNAHGTGTPLNDTVESLAIHRVFGDHARRLPVSSTKGAVGHTLGSAGAIEALATILSLRDDFVPPTVNLEEPDPEMRLDLVMRTPRSARLRHAMSNSYGFGGNNTSLVFAHA